MTYESFFADISPAGFTGKGFQTTSWCYLGVNPRYTKVTECLKLLRKMAATPGLQAHPGKTWLRNCFLKFNCSYRYGLLMIVSIPETHTECFWVSIENVSCLCVIQNMFPVGHNIFMCVTYFNIPVDKKKLKPGCRSLGNDENGCTYTLYSYEWIRKMVMWPGPDFLSFDVKRK